MHHDLLSQVAPLVSQYGYAVLFPIAVLEGPAVTIVAGALVASGQFDGLTVFLMLVGADLVGDVLYYSLGRWGHTPFLERLEKRLSLTQDRFRPWEEGFRRHDWKFLLIGKTQPFGSVILYFAGATKMAIGRYVAFNLLATVPKVVLFEAIGYFLGASIAHSMKYIDYLTFVLFGIAAVLFYAYYRIKKYLTNEISKETSL
ncbi:MAG: DedA family protein [Caulobacteraceae bacterium]